MSDPKMVNTPAGPAVRLDWPAGASKFFSEPRGEGFEQASNPVEVVAVRLETGEVKFYTRDVLS